MNEEEVDEVIKSYDLDGCKGLSKEEFKNMMID